MSEELPPDADLFGLPDDPQLRRRMLEEAANLPEDRWPQQLAELLAFIEAVFKRRGMSPRDAFDLASEVTIEISYAFGGQCFYMPLGKKLRTALRDAEIWRQHNGRPEQIPELAKKYGVTEVYMYDIIARQRKLHVNRHQGSLFPEEG